MNELLGRLIFASLALACSDSRGRSESVLVPAGAGGSAIVAPGEGDMLDSDALPMDVPGVAPAIPLSAVNELDLLLMIDNSLTMADKQEILRAAVPDLWSSLTAGSFRSGRSPPAAQRYSAVGNGVAHSAGPR